MRWLLGLLTTTTLTAGVWAQDVATTIHTNAAPLPRDVLDRLNLKQAWRTYLPVAARRDGIFTVQFDGDDMFIQTQSGQILCLDPETGREKWHNLIGVAFRPTHHLGFNKKMVFAVQGVWVYALDRASGGVLWEFNLPNAPSAAPVADDKQVFFSLGASFVYSFDIISAKAGADRDKTAGSPGMGSRDSLSFVKDDRTTLFALGRRTVATVGPLSKGVAASLRLSDAPQPLVERSSAKVAPHFVEETPLQTSVAILYGCADGGALSLTKDPLDVRFHYPTRGAVTAAPGQHEDTAFVASLDSDVTALSITLGRTLWRFPTPAPVLIAPQVTDTHVYASPRNSGLYCLDRKTGDLVWRNTTAERFLAANDKFVYALDGPGRLMVLDKKRGTTISGYDTRDFVVHIPNERTDRIYLAAHNGLLLCLHDKDQVKPLITKYAAPPKPPAEKPDEMPPVMPDEKPKP